MVLPFNVALYSGVSVAALFAAAGADAYAVGGNSPEFVADFAGTLNSGTEYYRSGGSDTTFESVFTFTRPTTATYVNSIGVLTTASSGVARLGHHVYNGTSWENAGILIEPAAATNLLLNSGTLSTQSVTVTAVAHTLHFTGTGTITLSGASTAGPLVGTGTGENNRVSLTFTPSAGSLTCTVSGTVTNAQLEVGSVPTSYIPTAGSTVTRAAETLTIAGPNLPYSATAMSFHVQGRMTYADKNINYNEGLGDPGEVAWFQWRTDSIRHIAYGIRTFVGTGQPLLMQRSPASGSDLSAFGSNTTFAPGITVTFNASSRHTSSGFQGAVSGVSGAENTGVIDMPDLSSTNLALAWKARQSISLFRMWGADIGETGIEEAST